MEISEKIPKFVYQILGIVDKMQEFGNKTTPECQLILFRINHMSGS